MKLSMLLNDSRELLQIVGEKAIASDKPTIAVCAYTFVAGLTAFMQWFTSNLPTFCMVAGFVGTIILAHLNWKKSQREEVDRKIAEIDRETAELNLRIAREKMLEMKIETRKRDTP